MIQISQFLTNILSEAHLLQASDIHIQPCPQEYRIRFRIDGLIEQHTSISNPIGVHLISRIKVLAHMDVAEKRRPQDGTFSFNYHTSPSEIRVGTFPTIHGEKVVLRILDSVNYSSLSLRQLGLSDTLAECIEKIVALSHGFLIVTGSTGSGKTTTLHALLSTLESSHKNIVTLEDPVEYVLEGITQTRIHQEIGLTFQAGLRSLLRQDPDVIMVGEIRDKETAQVAVQAALTGHQVLTTLHTNDALGALMRLTHMGIERYLLAGSVKAIIAQQLVRRICKMCAYTHEPSTEQQTILQKYSYVVSTVTVGRGCKVCRGSGFKGRIGIFQFLQLSPLLCSLFVQGADYEQLLRCAEQFGMGHLHADAFNKLKEGIISFNEFVRVAASC